MKFLLLFLIIILCFFIIMGCKQKHSVLKDYNQTKTINYEGEKFKEIMKNVKMQQESAANIASSDVLEILPTMDTFSEVKNQVWAGTFQLVWNDLINELLKAPLEFVNYKSITAENLNKQEFTEDELSAEVYYKKWGEALPSLKEEIENEINRKFNETSDILGQLQWDSTPEYRKYVLYAILKKEFEFLEKFSTLGKDKFEGSKNLVEYFGLSDSPDYKLLRSIKVLFYEDPQNFAVELNTKQGDKVYIYRNNENKTLDVLYNDMLKKSGTYKGNKKLNNADKFKVPLIDFKTEREFPEFYYKAIKGTDFTITKAIETIEFKMNETGVKLKSEAAVAGEELGIPAEFFIPDPRYFNADGPFVMFIQENGHKPYFAMKVRDAAELQ